MVLSCGLQKWFPSPGCSLRIKAGSGHDSQDVAVGKSKKLVLCPGQTRMLTQAVDIIDNGDKIKRNCG